MNVNSAALQEELAWLNGHFSFEETYINRPGIRTVLGAVMISCLLSLLQLLLTLQI